MAEEDKHERFHLPLFDGTNFTAWKFRMRVLLEEYDLLQCLEAEAVDLEEMQDKAGDSAQQLAAKAVLREKRAKKDRKCKSLLVSRIHDSQLEYVQEKETPKQIMDTLIRVFERKSIASRMHLKRKMLTLRFDSGKLQDHFLQFDRIVREYRGTGAVLEEVDVICHLLLTLGPAYATVVTTLETMPEENLSLEFVKCRLLDEEIKQSGSGVDLYSSKTEPAAFVGGKKPKQKKKLKCFGCQEEGHKIADCPKKKQPVLEQHEKKPTQKKKANVAESSTNAVCFVTLESGESIPEKRRVQWIVDSGCSDHLVNNEELFEELIPLAQPIEIAVAKDGESIIAHSSGTVRVLSLVDGRSISCTVSNVLYVPSLRTNLFSVLKVETKGMRVVFEKGKVDIFRGSEVVATGKRRGQCYELDVYTVSDCQADSMMACGRVAKDCKLWHRRFGHLNMSQLSQLIAKNMVDGLPTLKTEAGEGYVCEPCIIGKQARKPFSMTRCGGKRSKRVLEVIHTDVCGPISPVGANGEQYFVTFIDDWSHFVMIFPMVTKDEVFDWFKYYVALVTAKFGKRVSRLKCDNGGEYRNKAFDKYCRKKGIKVEWTVPYTPPQNGTSERMNRTIVERARAMLEDSKIDKKFWVQAVETAAHVVNRCPTRALKKNRTPYQLWEGKRPDVSHLRAFGSIVYVHIPKERRKKLDAKVWKGVMVGYAHGGYRVWNPETNTIVTARDVDFVELPEQLLPAAPEEAVLQNESDTSMLRIRNEEEDESSDASNYESELESEEPSDDEDPFESICEDNVDNDVPNESVSEAEGRPSRERHPPSWHRDYEVEYAHFAYSALSYVEDLPDSLAELQKRPDWPMWQQALREEMDSLLKNRTWTLAKLPAGRNAVTCKWIFKIKPADNDQPARYKARLVARGFSQKRGFDYTETYSPVARLDTLRLVLALANYEEMFVHQMDVKTAFLNGELSEEIFMQQPEGFATKDGLVCRLNKSLYGLKQASRSWNERFHTFMEKLGFVRSANDPCLYLKGKYDYKVMLVLYVDDVLIASPSEKLVKVVKGCLSQEFEMSDLDEVRHFLGMKIDRDLKKRTMRINQRRYLESLLSRFHMDDCRPISTPMENRLKLPKGDDAHRTTLPYRELVGCLMYVSLTTRPDLAAAANYFSQFQACPTEQHWVHLRRVLRYVKGTLDFGLVYCADNDGPLLEAYSDADWGNDITDRRSVSGAVFKVFGATVSWIAKKQPTVSLSSTEAELVALCVAVCHGQWLTRILDELGWHSKDPVPYHEDNQSTIKIVSTPKDSGRLKHIDVKYFFVRELVESNSIKVDYVSTDQQQADIFTKGLPAPAFRKHRGNIGVHDCSV